MTALRSGMSTTGRRRQGGIAVQNKLRRMCRGKNDISQYDIISKAGEDFQKIIFTLLKIC
jgi:hypothetical protein